MGVLVGAVVCITAGLFISANYLKGKDVRTFEMWQQFYSPAVAIACGYGYVNLPSFPDDSLVRFLEAKTDTFDCANALSPDKYHTNDGDISGCRYLIALVGVFWRVVGPSWHSVKFVIAMLYALMGVATFFLARTVIGTGLSIGVSVLYVSAPANIELMSRLRDLGKAPFILLACAILIMAIDSSSRRRVALAIVTGLLIGVGYGFRPDILALLPLSIFLLLVIAPRKLPWSRRLTASLVLPISFLLGAAPALTSDNPVGTNLMPHVVILGLSHLSDYNLGVQPGNYSWGMKYDDKAVMEMLNAYSALKFPKVNQVRYGDSEYGRAGRSYLLEMLRTFPADMMLRVEAASLSLLNESVTDDLRLNKSQTMRGVWLIGLVWLAVTGIILIAFHYPHRALGFGLIFVYLTAVVGLQFEDRHYFYMEVFSLISMVAVLDFFVVSRFRPSGKSIAIAFFASAALLVIVQVFEVGLQHMQSVWVGPRLARFIKSPSEPLNPVIRQGLMSQVYFPQLQGRDIDTLPIYPETPLPSFPLVMTIDRERCGSSYRYFNVDYGILKHLNYTFWIQPYPQGEFGVWSEQHLLPNLEGLANEIQVTVPLYRNGMALRDIQLSPGMATCVVRWERLLSNDPIFDTMNWIIDKPEHLIPYRIELAKPMP